MTVSNITKSNTKWPPYGFIIVGKVNMLSRKFFTASLSYRVWVLKDNMLIYLPILSTLEKDEENGALIVERNTSLLHSSENSASVVSQESRYGWLNRLCSAEPLLRNRKYNRKGQRLIPSNAILTHTYTSLGIYFGKNHPNSQLSTPSEFFNTYLSNLNIIQGLFKACNKMKNK